MGHLFAYFSCGHDNGAPKTQHNKDVSLKQATNFFMLCKSDTSGSGSSWLVGQGLVRRKVVRALGCVKNGTIFF